MFFALFVCLFVCFFHYRPLVLLFLLPSSSDYLCLFFCLPTIKSGKGYMMFATLRTSHHIELPTQTSVVDLVDIIFPKLDRVLCVLYG